MINKRKSRQVSDADNAWLLYLAAGLGLLSWLIPDHYPPWGSFYNEFAAFLGLGVLLLHTALEEEDERPRFPRWIPFIALVAIIPLVQACFGHIYFLGDGWMASSYLLGLALACMAGFIIAERKPGNFALAMASLFLAGALLSSFAVLYQRLDLEGLDAWILKGVDTKRPTANLAQANNLATLLCLGLGGLAYLYSSNRVGRTTGLLASAVLILCITLTQSRTPWLIACFAAAWWVIKGRRIPNIPGRGIAFCILLFAGLTLSWALLTTAEITTGTIAGTSSGQRYDLTEPGPRIAMWQGLVKAALERPWLGYGWNQVSVAHLQTVKDYPLPEMVTHSHNLLIDLLIWNGIPLGMLIITGLGYWLFTRARHTRTQESWFGLLAIGIVGVHSLLEYPLDYAYFLVPVGLLAGMIDADQTHGRPFSLPRPVLWPALAAFALVMGLIWHEYRIAEEDYRLARFETRRIGPLKAPQPAPDLVLLTQIREDLRFMRTQLHKDMSEEKLAWMQKVAYRYPYYANIFRYGLALAINDRVAEAGREIQRLGDMYGPKPYAMAIANLHILAESEYPEVRTLIDLLD